MSAENWRTECLLDDVTGTGLDQYFEVPADRAQGQLLRSAPQVQQQCRQEY
jgi:hypothetical protein